MLTIFAATLFLSSEIADRDSVLRILKNNGQNEGKRAQYECGTFGDLRRYRCGAAFLITRASFWASVFLGCT